LQPDEMVERLLLLGYRSFGVESGHYSEQIIRSAKQKGAGYVPWNVRKLDRAGAGCDLLETGDKNYGFRALFVPLSADFRLIRKYVLREKNTLDAIMISFREVRNLYEADPKLLFKTLSFVKSSFLGIGVPFIPSSEARAKGELVTPLAMEGILSVLYSRPEPLSISAVKNAYERLEALTQY